MVYRLKIDKQIHITLVIESISEDRAKDRQSLDLVLPAQVQYSLQIQFNQFYIGKFSDYFWYLNT